MLTTTACVFRTNSYHLNHPTARSCHVFLPLQTTKLRHGVADEKKMTTLLPHQRLSQAATNFELYTVSVQERVQNICARTFTVIIYLFGRFKVEPSRRILDDPCIIVHLDEVYKIAGVVFPADGKMSHNSDTQTSCASQVHAGRPVRITATPRPCS